MVRHIVSIFFLLAPLLGLAQTLSIKGVISNYNSTKNLKAHVAYWQLTGYTEAGAVDVGTNGQFEMALTNPIKPSVCILCFDSGDTIVFIGGTDKVLSFRARWYEGIVIEPKFEGSAENELLKTIKNEMAAHRAIQDSVARVGSTLDEFDGAYQTKTTALREALQHAGIAYNNKLNELRLQYPNSYCARAIVPVILKTIFIQDTAWSKKYDTNRAFQHHHFFGKLTADSLITTTPFLREKINEYINFWVGQQEKRLKEGTDKVVNTLAANEAIRKYAISTLTDYFTEQNNFPLLDYLYSTYISTCEAPPLQGKSAAIVEQMKRLAKGNKAPELIMPDDKGNYFWLSQMKTRKYVVLFFWASWCQHCNEMMPDVIKFYNEAKAKGVDVVAVSLDDNKEQWLNFVAKNKLSWTNVSDLKHWDSEAVRLYALRATPTFYVLDSSLTIIGRTNDLDELKSLVR